MYRRDAKFVVRRISMQLIDPTRQLNHSPVHSPVRHTQTYTYTVEYINKNYTTISKHQTPNNNEEP